MKPPTNASIVATPLANCWFENKLLCVDNLNCERTLQKTKQHYKIVEQLARDEQHCILKAFPRCDKFPVASRVVSAFHLVEICRALAIVAPPESWEALRLSFKPTKRVGVPVELFSDEQQARSWLIRMC